MQRSAASSLLLSTQVSRSMEFVPGPPEDPIYIEKTQGTDEIVTSESSTSSPDNSFFNPPNGLETRSLATPTQIDIGVTY